MPAKRDPTFPPFSAAPLATSVASAASDPTSANVKKPWVTIRGEPIVKKPSEKTEQLAVSLVRSCQNDGCYPSFTHTDWRAVIKMNSDGDILIRPQKLIVQDEAPKEPATIPCQTWVTQEERCLNALKPPFESQDEADIISDEEPQVTSLSLEAHDGESTPKRAKTDNLDLSPVNVATPPEWTDFSPETKYLLKKSIEEC